MPTRNGVDPNTLWLTTIEDFDLLPSAYFLVKQVMLYLCYMDVQAVIRLRCPGCQSESASQESHTGLLGCITPFHTSFAFAQSLNNHT